jgi:hypothetical protein
MNTNTNFTNTTILASGVILTNVTRTDANQKTATRSNVIRYEDDAASPNPKLLPFGGFEVAVLLSKLHDSACAAERTSAPTVNFSPVAETARSGYLRSKMAAAQIGF